MDKNTLFGKTAAGREALTSRPAGLAPRLRSLLIMVDAKRNLSEFEKITGSLEQATSALSGLIAGGWIEIVGADGLPKAVPLPAALLPFSEARGLVVGFINDQLGPMGETLAMLAEGCKTPADLQIAVPGIREGLNSLKGSAVLQQFDEELLGRLPRV